jgi:hypothetical protein
LTGRTVPVVLAICVTSAAFTWAHDGHGETVVISGTIRALSQHGLDVEALEKSSLQLTRVSVVTDAKTQYSRGKRRVPGGAARPAVGERVSIVARSEHGDEGSIRWLALRIQLGASPTR